MIDVIGVRFKKVGKLYYFLPNNFEVKLGDEVIVETARGVEYGEVVKVKAQIKVNSSDQPIKKIVRLITDEDRRVLKENAKKEKDAIGICGEKIAKLKLDMKLVNVELTFDRNKMIFYFTSDGRVDFRELVKELASIFRTRIELRQIGVRDEAKMLNGIGMCGRGLCCATFLGDFQPVSIKMAKEQNLSLNPTKISGICGRLMCCLKYEEEVYEELNKNMPNVGDTVETPDGSGEVVSAHVLLQQVKVVINHKENETPAMGFYNVSEVKVTKVRRRREYNSRDNRDYKDRENYKNKDGKKYEKYEKPEYKKHEKSEYKKPEKSEYKKPEYKKYEGKKPEYKKYEGKKHEK